jgi:hypothetical protein
MRNFEKKKKKKRDRLEDCGIVGGNGEVHLVGLGHL